MQCVYTDCNYKDGWDGETLTTIKGSEGQFYFLSNEVTMERSRSDSWRKDIIQLTGCPKCKRVFITD